MAQNLRAAGWLRFGNQGQLGKGLRAFAAESAPDYFDENSWDVVGLDATIRLDVELPGDFTQVVRPFVQILIAASAGYIDYFEGDGRGTGFARYLVHKFDRRHRFVSPERHTYAAKTGEAHLVGKLGFETPRALEQVLGEGKLFRLPYLTKTSIEEIRIPASALAASGTSLTAALAIADPSIADSLVEVARALALKAKTGAFSVTGDDVRTRSIAAPKAKVERLTIATKAGKMTKLSSVAANTPVAPTKQPAGDDKTLLLQGAGATKDAMLLSSGMLVTWSDSRLAFWDLPNAKPSWTVEGFAWPIAGVTELEPGRVVVYHEMNGDLDFVDRDRQERTTVQMHDHSVFGVYRLADRCLSWSLDGTARSFTPTGEVLSRLDPEIDGAIDAVHAVGDGTVLVRADNKLFAYDLASGKRIGKHRKCELLWSLPDGRVLLALDKHHELRDASGTIAKFDIRPDFSAVVVAGGEDRYLLHHYHSRGFHELRRSAKGWTSREVSSQHTKSLGGIVPLGDGMFATHARTMPGLDERFGFDGKVRLWNDALEPIGELDMKAPISRIVALPGARAAVVMRDALRGKAVAIVDARKRRIASTLDGPKKPVVGALWIPARGLLVWSADKTTRIYALA